MVYLFLAEGFEEIEAITVADVLRRAGDRLQTVAVSDKKDIAGTHNITVKCDITIYEADRDAMEMIILPGGMPGRDNLLANRELK